MDPIVIPLSFLMILMLAAVYSMVCCIDITVAHAWAKKKGFYPILQFTCFCGWHQSLTSRGMYPTNFYQLNKVVNHTKSCLVWMFNADFNGLLPYWAHVYAEDLRQYEKDPSSRFLTPAYFLKAAKQRSTRERAGANAFDDTFETKDKDQLRREGYKV